MSDAWEKLITPLLILTKYVYMPTIAWYCTTFCYETNQQVSRAKGRWGLQNESPSTIWIPKEKWYKNESLLLCMIIVIIMMCGLMWGFKKLNYPNWLFDDKTWVQWSQRSHYVDVDIVPCSIRGVEALPTIYPRNCNVPSFDPVCMMYIL